MGPPRKNRGRIRTFTSPGRGGPIATVWNPSRKRHARIRADIHRQAEPLSLTCAFTRADLQPVLHAIRAALGCGALPLDSPNRLQEALRTLIVGLGGGGEVTVRRSPAALLTPEYWQVDVADLDRQTHEALQDLFAASRR